MKNWRFWALLVLSLMLWRGVAVASVPFEHYEALTVYGGRVYALMTRETHTDFYDWEYFPSRIAELDENLNELRSLELKDGTNAAKNSGFFALHGGKLYVGSIGGDMGGGEAGDVWEVDIETWTASQVLDVSSDGGISGLAIANDGTAFILVGGYDASWNFQATLYVTTAGILSGGTTLAAIGPGILISGSGYSWGLAWSEPDEALWVMAGEELKAYSKTGAPLRTFSPLELGNNIVSIAALESGGLYYTVSDYVTASAGRITKAGSAYTVQQNLVTGFSGDTAVFTFRDHNNDDHVLMREFNYGPNDNVLIYDLDNFTTPKVNVSNWGTNIHAIARLGTYLYLGTYESYDASNNQLSGEIKRFDMSGWHDVQPEKPEEPSESTGGGGCDSGFATLAWLLLAPAALTKHRKR